ncbi:MAG: hypothetical protein BRC30_03565 [Nanohaloarchaea archaeon SW_7_46_7]|nr:MAG: hypothetical protein BRC30_03565 [Nanohaloarchaea archaeon SW_7_46_7]
MRSSEVLGSSDEMNNLVPENGVGVGSWMSEMGIEAEKAFVWPHEAQVEESIIEESEIEKIVGLSPRGGFSRREEVSVAPVTTHGYTGEDFDFEYGWAIADDTITSLKPQIEPENGLHQFDYPSLEKRDRALSNAFERITSTSDRLLKDTGSAVLYTMSGVNRYQMPEFKDNSWKNQKAYAERIGSHLEDKGFHTEIHYSPEDARDVYVSGQR